MNVIASYFRWSNSKLVTTDNFVMSRLLKLVYFFSLLLYRYVKPSRPTAPLRTTIKNFDADIRLSIDRSRAMGAALYWTGFHEFREFVFLHRFLKSDMVFVDVGANLGEYTLFAAKRLLKGKVMAFEPLPSMRRILHENITMNGFRNIEVYDFGLSDTSGEMMIHEFGDVHEGLATLYPGRREGSSAHSVKLRTLDEVIFSLGLSRLDFIKMDIEGGELNALQGCKKVVEHFKPTFMVEINAITYRSAGYSATDVFRFFEGLGYRPHRLMKGGLLKAETEIPEFANIVFAPQ